MNATAQGFGRFGYATSGRVPGISVDDAGFRVNHSSASKFNFPQPSKLWKPVLTTQTQQVVTLSEGYGCPSKLKQELLGPGFSLYYPNTFSFRLTSTSAPYLSWKDGTLDANTGLPTPLTNWALVSFRDNQPPILLAFPEKQASLKIYGKSGEWYVSSDAPFTGWLRVCAPTGITARRTNTAAELGQLVSQVKKDEELWTAPTPTLVKTEIRDDGDSIEVDYIFSSKGVVVPPPAILAQLGGASMKILSKTRRLAAPTEEGPFEVTEEDKLTLRSIARRVPTGRALHRGEATNAIATASYLDSHSVTELALTNLLSSSEPALRALAESTYAEFLTEAAFEFEPATGLSLPYAASGKALGLVASHALLMQSTLSVKKPTSEANSLLSSLMWRRDWLTWRFYGVEDPQSRSAAALVAITAAMAPEPERRLEGALFEAGLAAQVGLERWKKRQGQNPTVGNYLEVLPGIRTDIYGTVDYRRSPDFGRVMLSPVRIYSDEAVSLTGDKSSAQLVLNALAKPTLLTLASAFAVNVSTESPGWTLEQGFGLNILKGAPGQPDKVLFKFSCDEFDQIPSLTAAPRYFETYRTADPR